LWLAYGIHIDDLIIIVANACGVAFSITIITLRFKYMRQR